jgi:iron(III) transport system ATP-binding protein
MPVGTLVLNEVSKEFVTPEKRNVIAVNRANLNIEQGQFVTLLGPSGCGKTTTLRMIAGFEFPTSGSIVLDGKNIATTPPNKREMAMVFQSYALFPHLNVFDNIAYGLQLQRKTNSEIKRAVAEMTELVNLSGLEKRRPAELSGGQQQRVALARAIAVRPKVLLFDEPLSNLDAKLRVGLRTEIRRLQKQLGITSVYVTHDQAEAMSLSDLIVVMHAGKIEQTGTPNEIYRRPINRFVADFIGRANFLEVAVNAVNGDIAEITYQGTHMRVPSDSAMKAKSKATLVVRPEAIHVSESNDGFVAHVKSATYYGANVEYDLVTPQGVTLNVVDSGDISFGKVYSEGSEVRWNFSPERSYMLVE